MEHYECHRCGGELDPDNELDTNEHGDMYCHQCRDWCLEYEIVVVD